MNCLLCAEPSVKLFLEVDERIYWKCEHCLFVFLDSKFRLSSLEEKSRYQEHNNDIHNPDYRLFLSKLFEPMKVRLGARSRGLDFGCGPGPALAEMFKEEGYQVDIYDPFFFKDDVIFSKKYDFITCTEAIEHFFEPAKELKRLDSILVNEGFLGLMTTFLTDEKDFGQWYYRKDPTHVAFYQPKTFEVIASMMDWSYEIPTKDVVIFKK